MIYTTLSVHSLRATEITWSTTEITWRSRELRTQKGVGTGREFSGNGRSEGVEVEARDIYRCRVRCEVVPRVTGIRFPGAAGPCRGTGPSFTSRTSLDLIHAPRRSASDSDLPTTVRSE